MNISQTWIALFFSLSLFSCSNPSTPTQSKALGSVNDAPNALKAADTSMKVESEDSQMTNNSMDDNQDFNFPYDLSKWENKMVLDKDLMEISGLAFRESKKELLAINDEKGQLFQLDANSGQIIDKSSFADKGDYEAITIVGETVFVSKSSGTLYKFDIDKPKKSNKIKTKLSTQNDVEGLCYDAAQQQLLLACKGDPNLGKANKKKSRKAVYAFDLEKEDLIETPYFQIKDKDLEKFVEKTYDTKDISKKQLNKYLNRAEKFAPSAIAIHPIDQQIYLLSTVGKLMVVCNRNGKIKHIEFLNDNQQVQPEGLCFTNNGDLYLSNEGRGIAGTIYFYPYKS